MSFSLGLTGLGLTSQRVSGGSTPPVENWIDTTEFVIDPTVAASITGSPVQIITSLVDSEDLTTSRHFQQTVSTSSRPAITASRLVFDGTNDYLDYSAGYDPLVTFQPPDPAYAEAGKGPTCTGLAKAGDGSWWVGHYGKKNETTAGSETFHTSLCHYNSTFTTLIEEIEFTEDMGLLNPNGIQGIAIDPSTGNIHFSDLIRVYCIHPSAPTVLIYNVARTASGMAYDSIAGEMLAWTSSTTITRYNKATGASIGTFTIRDGNDRDHLFFDASYGTAGALYTTCRANGVAGRVVKYDMATKVPIKAWALATNVAIEGIVVDGNDLWTCADTYYHNVGAIAFNRILKYTVDTSSTDYGTNLVIAGVAKIAATPAGTVALVNGGDPINLRGAGLFFTTTLNQLQLLFRGSSTLATINWTLASATTEQVYYLVIDTVAHTASLYINGTLVSTQTDALITGTIPSLVWTLGASYETSAVASKWSATTHGGFIVSTDTTHQPEIEGYLAWQTGNQSLLPLGHLYKDSPPS